MKRVCEKLLWGAGLLLLILSFGCESDDLKDKDDTEDRFQFLRRDEPESVKDSSMPLKDEEVLSKAPYPHPVSEEKIKKLEVRPIPKAKIIPGGSTANAPRFYDDFIALTDADDPESHHQSIQPRSAAYAVFRTDVMGKLILEFPDFIS